jgi:hypothetical protein
MTTTPRRAPSPISGSIGSRIRIIFGDTASEYLLIFNEEDDDSKWQSYYQGNLWTAVARQLRNCKAKGRHVTCIDFGPTGAWFMAGQKRDGSGHHSWWNSTTASSTIKEQSGGNDEVKASFGSNEYGSETSVVIIGSNGYACRGIDNDLRSRIDRIHERGKMIHFVRLFYGDKYFISDSEGTGWSGMGPYLSKELKNGRGKINDVAVAKNGCWVVIRDDRFASSQGVPKEVDDLLNKFYMNQRARNQARQNQIQQHAAELLQQAAELVRVVQERTAQEERERAERERVERERVERERAERERAERERVERKRAERERAAKEAAMAEALVSAHLRELTREVESIRSLEQQLETRKRLCRASYESLPPSMQSQLGSSASILCAGTTTPTSITSGSSTVTVVVEDCVVCQDRKAAHATVPCGHHCLCDECASDLTGRSGRCPLCRTQVQSTLKIYL